MASHFCRAVLVGASVSGTTGESNLVAFGLGESVVWGGLSGIGLRMMFFGFASS